MSSLNIDNVENLPFSILDAYCKLLLAIRNSRSFEELNIDGINGAIGYKKQISKKLNGNDIQNERKPKITKKSLKAKKKDLLYSAEELLQEKRRGRPKGSKNRK